MPPYKAHPYVDKVSQNGDQIDLRVEVTDFKTTEGGIEISGQATQNSGAFASFSQIVDLATATVEKETDAATGVEYWFVTVTADTVPPHKFMLDKDITVFVRVAKVWVTVLGEQPSGISSEKATDPLAWGEPHTATQLDGKSWAQWRAQQATAQPPPPPANSPTTSPPPLTETPTPIG